MGTSSRNVDYFPSYEIVQNSERAATWERDLRHVTSAGVQHIIDLFERNYLEKAWWYSTIELVRVASKWNF
jgi:GSCFA family